MKYALLDTNYDVGIRVRNFRESQGYTREGFAEILDISPSTLANVELGRTQIPNIMLVKLYDIFGISSDDILHGTEKSNNWQKRINRMLSNLSTNKLKYIYKVIVNYISLHK